MKLLESSLMYRYASLLGCIAKRPGIAQIVEKKRYKEGDQSLQREILCLCQVKVSALAYQQPCAERCRRLNIMIAHCLFIAAGQSSLLHQITRSVYNAAEGLHMH